MNIYKNVCLIPAKAASSRLKKKNLLKIRGKELIYYPIKAAQQSNLFDSHIWISTESEEIKKVAKKYGANVHLRPEFLAYDPYGVCDVALDFLEANSHYLEFDNLFILLPTSPMILAKDIQNALKIFCEENVKYLMSVTEFEHSAYRAVLVKQRRLIPLFEENMKKKTQELEKTYRVNGAITIVNISDFVISKTYYTFPIAVYIMPRERGIDIDTEFDYILAKLIMENDEVWERIKKF